MCRNFKDLNNSTIKEKFPFSVIDDILHELNGTQLFTKHDLHFGYDQNCMEEVDIR